MDIERGFDPDQDIALWRTKLGIDEFDAIKAVAIVEEQVTEIDGSVGGELVGVVTYPQNRTAVIYHTRQLAPDDIIHELLHVKHPHWTEEQVNNQTNLYLT